MKLTAALHGVCTAHGTLQSLNRGCQKLIIRSGVWWRNMSRTSSLHSDHQLFLFSQVNRYGTGSPGWCKCKIIFTMMMPIYQAKMSTRTIASYITHEFTLGRVAPGCHTTLAGTFEPDTTSGTYTARIIFTRSNQTHVPSLRVRCMLNYA